MPSLNTLTLHELRELLRTDTSHQLLDDYITDNLVVALNPPVNQLLATLSEDTYALPEMRIMVLTQGTSQPVINLVPRQLEAGDIVFISHNSLVQVANYSDNMQGFGISLTDELASLALGATMPHMLDGHIRDFHFRLAPQEQQQLWDIHALLLRTLALPERPSQVVLQLVAAFLWQTDFYWSQYEEHHRHCRTREQQLFTDFVQLVSQYATEQHHIDFYAQQLCISSRYMSTLVKQASGKSAKQWIDDAIITRIKTHLRHTDMSVAQIADAMHFSNAAFFCKYFKRMTGITARAYRQRL